MQHLAAGDAEHYGDGFALEFVRLPSDYLIEQAHGVAHATGRFAGDY